MVPPDLQRFCAHLGHGYIADERMFDSMVESREGAEQTRVFEERATV
jgi:hypothetical protein